MKCLARHCMVQSWGCLRIFSCGPKQGAGMASNHTSHMHSSLSSWCKSCSAPRPCHQWPTTCRSFGARVGSLTPTGGGTRSCCKRTVITTHLIIVASGAVAPACEASGPVQHHSLHPMARRILRCIICRLGSGFVLIMELSLIA